MSVYKHKPMYPYPCKLKFTHIAIALIKKVYGYPVRSTVVRHGQVHCYCKKVGRKVVYFNQETGKAWLYDPCGNEVSL